CCCYSYSRPPHPHSFPTRRSSDPSDGTVKKTALSEFARPRSTGIRAIELSEGNRLVGVGLTSGESEILLFSDAGKSVRFAESEVDRKSTRLNSSHVKISYAVFCLK